MAVTPDQVEAMRRVMALVGVGRPPEPETLRSAGLVEAPAFRVLTEANLEQLVTRVKVGIPDGEMPEDGMLEQRMQSLHASLWLASVCHMAGLRNGAITAAATALVSLDAFAELGSEEAVASLQCWSDAFASAGIIEEATKAAQKMRVRP